MAHTNLSAMSTVTRGLSTAAIWSKLLAKREVDPLSVALFIDDFVNFSQHVSDQDTQQYSSYIDSGVTLKALDLCDPSDGAAGVMRILHDGTDNDEGSLSTGGNTGGLVVISSSAADKRLVCFEARVRKSSVADNVIAFFLGLAEAGLAAADTLVDNTGELADKDFVGFRVKQDNGEELDCVYRVAGGSVVEAKANAQAMAASTWYKLGFVYDPDDQSDRHLRWYIDGEEVEAARVSSSTIGGTTFPDGEELALLFATKLGSATACSADLDWWAAGIALD